MSEHLPECEYEEGHNYTKGVCICPELRACEQRVEESMDRAWAHTLRIKQSEAYANGLAAARDAVDAACGWRPAGRCSECTHALAAIDALATSGGTTTHDTIRAPHLDPCDCDDCKGKP